MLLDIVVFWISSTAMIVIIQTAASHHQESFAVKIPVLCALISNTLFCSMTSTALYNGPGLSGWQDRRLLGPTAPAAGTLVVPEVFAAAPVKILSNALFIAAAPRIW